MNKFKNPNKSYGYFFIPVLLICFSNIQSNELKTPKANDSSLFKIGKAATKEEIAGWDIDIRPDGHGLPDGGATASEGEELYDEKCASCHGTFGEGESSWPKLIGEHNSIKKGINPEKTVGTFWAHPSTLMDYIHRAMPFTQPQSLSWGETWAISAYVLNLNDIIEDDFLLNRESFAEVKMPNAGNFIADLRPDVHASRCMKDCKNESDIKIKEALLGYASGAEDADNFNVNNDSAIENKHPGEETYELACKICHNQGVGGAPKINDSLAWENRLKQGVDKLYMHANNGYQGESGFMPAKGGQSQLTEKQVNDAVEFILMQNNLKKEKQ